MAEKVYAVTGMLQNVWAFVDGTFRFCCKPSGDAMFQRALYTNYKKQHGLKFQGVAMPNGLFWHLCGPISGIRNDSYLLYVSGVMDYLDPFLRTPDRTFALYGDGAYATTDTFKTGYSYLQLLHPFRGAARRKFNRRMSRARICVEWMFGAVAIKFAFLDFKKNLKVGRTKVQPIGQRYIGGCLFNNFHACLYGSLTSKYFSCLPPTIEDYLTAEAFDLRSYNE